MPIDAPFSAIKLIHSCLIGRQISTFTRFTPELAFDGRLHLVEAKGNTYQQAASRRQPEEPADCSEL